MIAMSPGEEEMVLLNQLGAHGQGHETAIGAPQRCTSPEQTLLELPTCTETRPDLTAMGKSPQYCLSAAGAPTPVQRITRSGGNPGAPSPSCSTDAQDTFQHVTFKEDRIAEKGLAMGPGRQIDSPRLQSQGPIDSTSTSLERITISRRVAKRVSVNRSRQCIIQPRDSTAQAGEPEASQHLAMILISSARKPISYINQAKRLLSEHGEVHLSALGGAIEPMVTVAESMKSRQLAIVTKLHTSLEHVTANERCRGIAKMDIVLGKSSEFDAIIEAEFIERQTAPDIAT